MRKPRRHRPAEASRTPCCWAPIRASVDLTADLSIRKITRARAGDASAVVRVHVQVRVPRVHRHDEIREGMASEVARESGSSDGPLRELAALPASAGRNGTIQRGDYRPVHPAGAEMDVG